MSGMFGAAGESCLEDLFYGTDYHSHLGPKFGGLGYVRSDGTFLQKIREIDKDKQFRGVFQSDLDNFRTSLALSGREAQAGIGVISDHDSQPLKPTSRFGEFIIMGSGFLSNLSELAKALHERGRCHFLLTAPPLRLPGAVGSPVTPIATL